MSTGTPADPTATPTADGIVTEARDCIVVGGGPAGVMLALILARGGVRVTVLEKHRDFLRDFRGDTVHASTIRLMDELGFGEAFAALPQDRLGNFELPAGDGTTVTIADFGRLDPPYDYIAMIPQWDLLDFLVEQATPERGFDIRMQAEVTGLTSEDGAVTGVEYLDHATGTRHRLTAPLTVACDGRSSLLREQAGLVPTEYPVPFDTWWFRLPRHEGERQHSALMPVFGDGELALSLVRDTFFQIAYFREKGADAALRAEGLDRFRERIAHLRPDLADRVSAITSLDEVHLLDVKLNRLRRWHRPGLLLIGDAAHAMSPAGGVGINLAVQDAVAAATRLAGPLRSGTLTEGDLAAVQRRRYPPTVIIQTLQRGLQKAIFGPAVQGRRSAPPAALIALVRRVPALSALPARLIALGPRPEHAPAFARRPGRTSTSAGAPGAATSDAAG
ncbi:FAD-dependent oxidoreductase [Tersicoccus sp. MR15.9]|uniref:FAD-dependent oxidoreductase n=1 Tax=Tersicoccus mangrovi TaxID=3121635 RepID=UPI002FE534DD